MDGRMDALIKKAVDTAASRHRSPQPQDNVDIFAVAPLHHKSVIYSVRESGKNHFIVKWNHSKNICSVIAFEETPK